MRGIFKSCMKSMAAAALALGFALPAKEASAQQLGDTMLGELKLVGFNFCPRGWALANGALLPISSNSALFSLLGTIYGGDGRTTFALPDLRGRLPINDGRGAGLSDYRIGQRVGAEWMTLTLAHLPSHNHTVNATNVAADSLGPTGKYIADPQLVGNTQWFWFHSAPPAGNIVQMNSNMLTSSGGNQQFNKVQPVLAMNWCVALVGIYPSRS